MASQGYNSPHNRRRRKLPHIQRNDNNSPTNASTMFWYSYQSALHWVRNHEDVISKCMQLLQIYPNLIQDASLDRVWEFIEPLLLAKQSQGKEVKHPDEKVSFRGTTVVSKPHGRIGNVKGPDIPHISVTESTDSPRPAFTISAKHARTPRVHMISRCHCSKASEKDRLLHNGVIDMLQEDFYVRVANTRQASRQNQDTNRSMEGSDLQKPQGRQFILAESDVCVYLFNDATLEDANCFHDLCTALAHKIPVIYVRYHMQQLPKTFCEIIQRNSNGCLTLNDYAEKFLQDVNSVPPRRASAKTIRSKNRLAPLTVNTRPSSATELSIRGNSDRKNKRKHSPSHSEVDLVLTLVSNFKNASVFDEADLDECSAKLKHSIYQILGICEIKSELPSINTSQDDNRLQEESLASPSSTIPVVNLNFINNNSTDRTMSSSTSSSTSTPNTNKPSFLRVPDPGDLISTREWGNSGARSAPPHLRPTRSFDSDGGEDGDGGGNFFFGNDVPMVSPPPVEQRATTYLIFDRNKTPDGPRRVEFPPRDQDSVMVESDVESDELEPMSSPIDFNDVDLSREVNTRGTPDSDLSSSASLF